MITLTSRIQNDLSSSVNNFDLLFHINASGKDYYLATESQTFNGIYYDDLIMKVGGLKESIDLKDKKIKLSGTTITINNAEINGLRFSDTIVGEMTGGIVDMYLKTQSCELLEDDCIIIASLKISGVSHDNFQITLKCEDRYINEFHKDLPNPEHTLYDGDRTFVGDNERRIPILYGHLKQAPAVVYINNPDTESPFIDNNIFIVPDRAFLDQEYNIMGIKDVNPFAENGSSFTNMLFNQEILSIKLGDYAATVYLEPPDRLHKRLLEGDEINGFEYNSDWYTQFTVDSERNYIILNTSGDPNAPANISSGHLLCGELSKLIGVNLYKVKYYFGYDNMDFIDSLPIYQDPSVLTSSVVGNKKRFDMLSLKIFNLGDFDDPDDYLLCSYHHQSWGDPNGVPDALYHNYGVPIFEMEFEQLKSSISNPKGKNRTNIYTDGHIIGSFRSFCKVESGSTNYNTNRPSYQMYSIYPQQANYELMSDPFQSPDNIVEGGNTIVENNLGVVRMITDAITSSINPSTEDPYYEYSNWDTYLYGSLRNMSNVFTDTAPFRIGNRIPQVHTENSDSFRHTFQTTEQNNLDYRWVDSASWSQTNIFTGYIHPYWTDGDSSGDLDYPIFDLKTKTQFGGMFYKRSWYQENVFNENFFINAKGKYNEMPNQILGGAIQIFEAKDFIIEFLPTEAYAGITGSNIQEYALLELIDYLTNDRLSKLYFGGHKYELVVDAHIFAIGEDPSLEEDITIFEFDVNSFYTDNSNYKFLMDSKIFRHTNPNGTENNSVWYELNEDVIFSSVVLRYGRRIFDSNSHLIGFSYLDEVNTSLDLFPKTAFVTIPFTPRGKIEFGYDYTDDNNFVRIYFTSFDSEEVGNHSSVINTSENEIKELIQRPSDVMDNILKKEFGLIENINRINIEDDKYLIDFSVYKEEEGLDVMQKISQSSPFFYKTSLYNGIPTIVGIKSSYNDADVNKSINENQLMKYKFIKSKIEDVALKCRVKYGFDYVKEEYTKTTTDIIHLAEHKQDYIDLYDIKDEDTYTLEYEAPYIQDELSAEVLAKHLFEIYKNQHLKIDFQIPLGDAIELEVGDIIDFVDNNGNITNVVNTKPYGLDMSSENEIIDQVVYPYFMITSIKKDLTKADILCTQLHKLAESQYTEELYQVLDPDDEDFVPSVGDINQDGNIDILDVIMLMNIIIDGGINAPYMNEELFALANIDGEGLINILDMLLLLNLILGTE